MINRSRRIEIGHTVQIHHNDKVEDCVVLNLSFGGMLIKSDLSINTGDNIKIIHDQAGELAGKIARKSDEGFAVTFLKDETTANFALQSITSGMLDENIPQANDGDDEVDDDENTCDNGEEEEQV